MDNPSQKALTPVEHIKSNSQYLRGTIAKGLQDEHTGAIADDDTQLSKFHGIYQQDDRDLRAERKKQKLEPAYSFMIRVRSPGGVLTPQQWLDMDHLAVNFANQTLRLTTRQAIQFHGVVKRNLKNTIASINQSLLDTLAACGDVNRNVMCTPNPTQSKIHGEVFQVSASLSQHLTPATHAYHEIWLDRKKVVSSQEAEPIYGKTYLPRKFKIGIAIPPRNDVDVYTQDLGFIAVIEQNKLLGFNVVVGGGMGMSHGEPDTYPRLGSEIGFCLAHQVNEVAEKVVTIQRDFGDRSNRKHARLKYTLDDRGLDWFTKELNTRLGWELNPGQPIQFNTRGDRYGWTYGTDKLWHLTLYIPNGRINDDGSNQRLTGLREIAKSHTGSFRLTANQNIIVSGVPLTRKSEIEKLAKSFGLLDPNLSRLKANALACVAFPSCGLAMAESERYLPSLLNHLDKLRVKYGINDTSMVTRMTGCPNGCARPYTAEIGFVGKAPGRYNLYLGASFVGDRLNALYKENINEGEILNHLEPLFAHYAKARREGEHFGDFTVRAGYVPAVENRN